MTDTLSAMKLRTRIIGTLIKDARTFNGKSVQDCAQAIGIPVETFEQYEYGAISPSLPELEGLSYYLQVPLDHFLGSKIISETEERNKQLNIERLIVLRDRMIGATIRQARQEVGLSIEELAEQIQADPELVKDYEYGRQPVPMPLLEVISGILSRSIREFLDIHGPVGRWDQQQRAVQDFKELPLDLQLFVSKPINRPYLDLAVRLSEMSVDRLRAVAEGLLEITY